MKCEKCGMEYSYNSMVKVNRETRIITGYSKQFNCDIHTTKNENILLCSGCATFIKDGQIRVNGKQYIV